MFVSKTEQKQPLYVQQCKAQEQQDKTWSAGLLCQQNTAGNMPETVKGYRTESCFDQSSGKFFFPSTPSISGEVQGTQILGAEPLSQALVTVLITGTIPSIPTEESKGMEKEGPAANV